MPRIAGVDLPPNKRMEVALTYIFGIGQTRARKILEKTGINPDLRAKDLPESETAKLRSEIESHYKVEGALRSEMTMSIKRLMDIGSYRGLRHRRGLPVRGQRTRTNARIRKGPKKGAGLTKARKAPPTAPKAA
jgi:small subunit ribosomal protein S13